jgi:hypothetical protein
LQESRNQEELQTRNEEELNNNQEGGTEII